MTGTNGVDTNRRVNFPRLLAWIRIGLCNCTAWKSILRMSPFRGERTGELVHGRFRGVVRGGVDSVVRYVT